MLFKANLPCPDVDEHGANTMPRSAIREETTSSIILIYNTIA